MNYGRRTNLISDDRGATSLATLVRREQNGPTVGSAPTSLGAGKTARRAEAGLTLTPPTRFRSILVPVDGDPFAEHALPLALGVARRSGATVQVIHVHSPLQSAYKPDELYFDSGLDAFLRHRQQAYLEGLARRLAKVTSVPVRPVFLEGRDIANSLYESASVGTDLVVMATHGRGPVGRFLFGDIANVLMRRLSVPVLFTRGYNSPADLTGDPLMRNVLIALDGSEFAEQVLDPALALGALSDADHTLLRVIPSMMDYSIGYPDGLARQPLVVKQQTEARTYLRSVAQRFGARTSRIRSRIVLDDQPTAKAILSFAQTHDADVIALATRGRGGLARLFHGSVADQVVRRASVPVMVFRPDAEQEGCANP
jgi:nucleotide-binding universal stress UspA family protein